MIWNANYSNGVKNKENKADLRNGWSKRKPKKFLRMIKSSRLVGVGWRISSLGKIYINILVLKLSDDYFLLFNRNIN